MATIDESIQALLDAAEASDEFATVYDAPPDSLGEDQYPSFVMSPSINYESDPFSPHSDRYNGDWNFEVSMLFDKYVIDSLESGTRPHAEMTRVREAFMTLINPFLTASATDPPFVMSNLRHYISRFSNREVRVVRFNLSRFTREDL